MATQAQPLIAAVNGASYGGGMCLPLGAGIRIAAEFDRHAPPKGSASFPAWIRTSASIRSGSPGVAQTSSSISPLASRRSGVSWPSTKRP